MSIIEKKKEIVDSLKNTVQESSLSILLNAQGITANDIRAFRKSLYSKSSQMRVSKNTFIKRCLDELDLNLDSDVYSYPTAIVSTKDSVVELAKTTTALVKEFDFIRIKGAVLDQEVVDSSVVAELSKLPTKDILIGKLIGSCQSPIQGLLYCLSGSVSGLVFVLNNIAEKKQKEV